MGAAVGRAVAFWGGLTGPSRRLLVGAVLIFAVGVFLLMRLSGQTDYATLASSATAADAAAITKQLDELGVPYRLRDGGSTVQVPAGELDRARLDLAASNLLDGNGSVGFEIFDKSNLGATDFTNRVNLVRAMEGELSRTIGRLEPVQTATVKIAMPEEELFTSEQAPTTAGVVLTLRPGAELEPGQVKGISKLVAMAVPGLKAADVTITDQQGNILEGADVAAGGATAAAQRLEIEGAYERSVQSRLDAMLAATLGPGKAVTQVDAVLDLDKVVTDTERFDPESATALDRETSRERLRAEGGGAGAVVGAAPNTPPGNTFPAAVGGIGNTDYTKTTERTRNGVDRTRQQVERTPGTVTSQAIAVQVSDEVPADVVAGVEEAVRAAVGFQEDRDQISVVSVPFAEDGTAKAAAAAAAEGGRASSGGGLDPMGIAKTAAAAIGVLLLALLARRSLRRRQSDLEKALPELLKRGPVPVAELDPAALPPTRQLEGQRKSPIEAQMEDLARRKPEDVAQLLRGCLVDGR